MVAERVAMSERAARVAAPERAAAAAASEEAAEDDMARSGSLDRICYHDRQRVLGL